VLMLLVLSLRGVADSDALESGGVNGLLSEVRHFLQVHRWLASQTQSPHTKSGPSIRNLHRQPKAPPQTQDVG
jgi:hypothetical protein